MTWTDAFRTSTFRTAALASGAFAVGTLALFAFIYWQTAVYEANRIDETVRHEAEAIAREPGPDIARDLRTRFAGDLHRLTFAALLAPDHHLLAGDLAAYPHELPADGLTHVVEAGRMADSGVRTELVTAVARILPDGRILVVGRSRRDLARLTAVVGRALAWGLLPALALGLAAGTWASMRTMARIAAFREALDRIMEGELAERLPQAGTRDTLDILAASVNRMLDRLQRLLGEVRGVGDSIAHDLRTPLARMRARLEGGRRRASTLEDLDEVASAAIADLDQCFGTITALLRIGELESAHRRSGFAMASLTAIVEEAADLYQPMADLRGLRLRVEAAVVSEVFGDRDLLFEMCANLLDNAMKFTPPDGEVLLALRQEPGGPVLLVADTGPGIPADERGAVMQRFYRSPHTSAVAGSGLGLSLVAAIVRLHGLQLRMRDRQPGLAVEVLFGVSADL